MKPFLAAILVLCCTIAAQAEPLTVDLHSPTAYRFEGWGTSLAWWASHFGDWDDENLGKLADAITDPVDGLGLSVFRFNIGGGDDPTHDHMRQWADIPGFQAGPDAPIDPEADPNQRRVLLALVERAESPIVEGFSNSPPWWMTRSGCASGGVKGEPNLPDERIDDFAAYLADVTRVFRDRWGVTFRTLEPFNEPNQTWWDAEGSQEGCYIPASQQPAVVEALHAALVERGLQDEVAISANDAHDLDLTLANLQSYPPEALARLGQINAHTYRGSRRAELRDFAAAHGKRLWQSESGLIGLERRSRSILLLMMQRLALDLNELRASAWVMWQVVDVSRGWTCFQLNEEEQTFEPTENFWLYSQFTRHIRPGDTIVPTDDPNVVAAVLQKGRAVVVVVNVEREPVTREVELTGIALAEGEPSCWRSTRRERHIDAAGAATRSGATLSITAAPRSVTTVELPLAE